MPAVPRRQRATVHWQRQVGGLRPSRGFRRVHGRGAPACDPGLRGGGEDSRAPCPDDRRRHDPVPRHEEAAGRRQARTRPHCGGHGHRRTGKLRDPVREAARRRCDGGGVRAHGQQTRRSHGERRGPRDQCQGQVHRGHSGRTGTPHRAADGRRHPGLRRQRGVRLHGIRSAGSRGGACGGRPHEPPRRASSVPLRRHGVVLPRVLLGNHLDLVEVLSLAEAGLVKHNVTKVRLEDIDENLEALGRGDVVGRQVIVFE